MQVAMLPVLALPVRYYKTAPTICHIILPYYIIYINTILDQIYAGIQYKKFSYRQRNEASTIFKQVLKLRH
jgi:hypothetical protein